MVGAYSIRRLQDSNKLSSKLPAKRYPVVEYPLVGRIPQWLSSGDLARSYDLERPNHTEIQLPVLYNQIIHSFVFELVARDDGEISIAVASDRARSSKLYVVRLETLADLFDYVAREEILEMQGSLIDGIQQGVRVSNHDVVEAKQAHYGDESRTWTDWTPPTTQEIFDRMGGRYVKIHSDTWQGEP